MKISRKAGEILYFIGSCLLLASGFTINSTSLQGAGLLSLYLERLWPESGIYKESGSQIHRLILDFIFLASSLFLLFSSVKDILQIFLRNELIPVSIWSLWFAAGGSILFEMIFRITGEKISRTVVILPGIITVSSGAALILGGDWIKIDPAPGFLYLVFLVIISFRKSYLGLTELLQ